MRPLSPAGRPLVSLFHVAPASVVLKIAVSGPPPIIWPTPRRRCHVDAYRTSGLFGSISRSLPPVSGLTDNTAFHVEPPSVVLKMPRSPPADHSGPCAAT